MKKIILILFLFLSCYIIFKLTEDKKESYLVIGDKNADNIFLKEQLIVYNNDYINQNYRIIDLIDIIKYNKELIIDEKKVSIHRLLKNADVLIISIGMNDLYYKLNIDKQNIYTYINNMINNINILLDEISTYRYKQVLFLGYYNISNQNNDIFTYLNYKVSKLVKEYKYEYIELNEKLRNNPKFYKNTYHFELNNEGYYEINKIIVEKTKKCWYNIKCIYYYDLY